MTGDLVNLISTIYPTLCCKQDHVCSWFIFLSFAGQFYYLIQPFKLTYDEAVGACQKDGAQIAKVGQMYAAWKLLGYDRCDPGWLADGSVRYPISRPRRRCSPTEAAVRFSGFPDKKHKLYGVYCFKGHNWATTHIPQTPHTLACTNTCINEHNNAEKKTQRREFGGMKIHIKTVMLFYGNHKTFDRQIHVVLCKLGPNTLQGIVYTYLRFILF